MKKDGRGSLFAGLAICWLLNLVHYCILWLMAMFSERTRAVAVILACTIWAMQAVYVAPLWRLLHRKSLPRTAKGMLVAALITGLIDLSFAIAAALRL